MAKVNPFDRFLKDEDLLQIAVTQYIQYQYNGAVIYHAPNEGKRSPFERYLMKKMGVKKGFLDLFILYKKKLIFLELKTEKRRKEKGAVTDEQQAWIDILNYSDIPAKATFGFDESIAFVDLHFKELKSIKM